MTCATPISTPAGKEVSRMAKVVLTAAQWRWVGDRWLEGYTMSELADFLGLHRETVRRGLVRIGIRPCEKSELTPLSEREAEYKNIKEYTELNDAVLMVKSMVHSEKAADVVPVQHGRWIWHSEERGYLCSECGSGCLLNYESDWHKSDWCPHCGAKMDLEG